MKGKSLYYLNDSWLVMLIAHIKANSSYNLKLEAKDYLTVTLSVQGEETAEEFAQFYDMNSEVSQAFPILSAVDDVVIISRGTPQ